MGGTESDTGQDGTPLCPVAQGGGCGEDPKAPRCTGTPGEGRDSGDEFVSLEGGGCSCTAVPEALPAQGLWALLTIIVALSRRWTWVLVLALLPRAALAFNADLLHVDDGGAFVTLLEGDPGPAFTPRSALTVIRADQLVNINDNGDLEPLVDNLARGELGVSVPLTTLVRVGGTLPVVWQVDYRDIARGPFAGQARGFVSVHGNTLRVKHGWQIDITGSKPGPAADVLMADRGALGMTWAFEHTRKGLRLGGNLGGSWRPRLELPSVAISEQFHYGAGVAWEARPHLHATAELFGRTPIATSTTRSGWPAELVFTAGTRTDNGWMLRAGMGVGLSKGIGAPQWRALAVVQRLPQESSDRDGDGLVDLRDLCPNRPEDVDTWRDRDGCPDEDNDKDSILDINDACPLEPETHNGLRDADGCPDAFVDVYVRVELPPGHDEGAWVRWTPTDGALEETQLPVIDNKWARVELPDGPWRFEAGGPELITDTQVMLVHDSPDKVNRVLLRPTPLVRGTLSVQLLDPITQAAVEGHITVASETCPVGFRGAEGDGSQLEARLPVCSWRVSAVADGHENAEAIAIVEHDQTTEVVLHMTGRHVWTEGSEVQTGGRLRFEHDSALLPDEAGAWLDALADWLVERTDVTLLRVEGRADESGHPAYNLDLSQRRAEAVVAALVQRGIDPARLQPLGSGESHAEAAAGPGEPMGDLDRQVRLVLLIWDRSPSSE